MSRNRRFFVGVVCLAGLYGMCAFTFSGFPSKANPNPLGDAVSTGPERRELQPQLLEPTGAPPRLSCQQARQVVGDVRARLPVSPPEVSLDDFAVLWADWFDPHGLWAVARDAELPVLARAYARDLVGELERSPLARDPCVAAEALGLAAKEWVDGLVPLFEGARIRASAKAVGSFEQLFLPLFDEQVAERSAHALVADFGEQVGVLTRALPELGGDIARAVMDRVFPQLSAGEWAEVVLAAAVRAYVPSVDPHGQWAPVEEEWSLLAGNPGASRDEQLWGDVLRTAVGLRIANEPAPPLQVDDLVLLIDGVITAGLSLEQVEQLAHWGPVDGGNGRRVVVLRAEQQEPLELMVETAGVTGADTGEVTATRVPYGHGYALVLTIPEIYPSLEEDLAHLLRMGNNEERPLGIVLDLRGNGGGSTEAATGVIGIFLPGAPSFSLLNHGTVREILNASKPQATDRWLGPVAAVVDGYTASAAEMIAGALDRYGRGILLGSRTFGKGCVQEYFDGGGGNGVVRVTTYLVALPDGSPLQRMGLAPRIALELPGPDQREGDIVGSAFPSFGPDLRDTSILPGARWPRHFGRVGPCSDAVICNALRRLGYGVSASRAHPNVGLARRVLPQR